jgi:hypothetical protein
VGEFYGPSSPSKENSSIKQTDSPTLSMSNNEEHRPEPFGDHVYQPIQNHPLDQEAPITEQDRQKLIMDAQIQRYLTKVQVLTPLAFLLNIASLLVCSLITSPTLKEINDIHWTQFTPNSAFILIYWATLFLFQVGFAILIVLGQKEFTKVRFVDCFLIGMCSHLEV